MRSVFSGSPIFCGSPFVDEEIRTNHALYAPYFPINALNYAGKSACVITIVGVISPRFMTPRAPVAQWIEQWIPNRTRAFSIRPMISANYADFIGLFCAREVGKY